MIQRAANKTFLHNLDIVIVALLHTSSIFLALMVACMSDFEVTIALRWT